MSLNIYAISLLLVIPKFASCQTFIHGTCVIAKIQGNHIIIGADSKRDISRIVGGMEVNETVLACKIHQEKEFYFAFAGKYPLTMENLIRRACDSSNNITDLLINIDTTVKRAMQDVFSIYRVRAPSIYNPWVGKHPFDLLVAFFDNHKPACIDIRFRLLYIDSAVFKIDTYTRDSFILGDWANVISEFNSPATWRKNNVKAIRRLIQKEIQADSSVGPPVDILEIWEKRSKWKYNKKKCSLN